MQKMCEIEMPPKTYIGPGCLEKITADIRQRERKRCLIVTDSFMAESAACERVKRIIESAGAKVFIYNGVCPNPTLETVTQGVEKLNESRADAVISLGGGSAHDCAKAIRLVASKQGAKRDLLLLIAVNTTAGTGSEVTRFAIITDEEAHRKLSLIDSLVLPDVAVNDALLMVDMPPGLTAQTGMDALTHALESYVSTGANPFTKANAAAAIELIAKWLPMAYEEGRNVEARDQMAYAQYLAGLAFSNSGLGMVHAMAHQLGGLYNLPHGLCNAVLLPHVIAYNLSECEKSYGQVMDLIRPGESGGYGIKGRRLIHFLRQLNHKLNIPEKLEVPHFKGKEKAVGENEEMKLLIEMTKADPSLRYNPRIPQEKDIKEIYNKILKWRDS